MSGQDEKAIELAAAAAAFLESDLGKHVTLMAGCEIDRCTEALKLVDPEDVKEIRRLQDTIRRNETLGAWLAEVIYLGNEAKQLDAEEVN